MEKQKRLKNSRYITGFDGLRSLAVVGVIFYHLLPTSMKGGYLGVPIFFVVSGYLITDLLRQEWEQNGKINIWQFYVRRMKRLYPALVFYACDSFGLYHFVSARAVKQSSRSCGQQLTVCQQLVANQ